MSDIRELILASQDIETREVPCPEWGVTVYVRSLTGKERDWFERTATKRGDNIEGVLALLVCRSARDAEGNLIFDDGDAAALNTKSARPIQRIVAVVKHISGLTDDDIESLAKNSESDPNEKDGLN